MSTILESVAKGCISDEVAGELTGVDNCALIQSLILPGVESLMDGLKEEKAEVIATLNKSKNAGVFHPAYES